MIHKSNKHTCNDCLHEMKDLDEEPCSFCKEADAWEPIVYTEESVAPPPIPVFTSDMMSAFFDELQHKEVELWRGKNKDYADHEGNGGGNTFTNFDTIAEELGMTPDQVVWVYLRKQLQALLRYVNHGALETEPLMNRIIDARNFLAILGGVARRRGDL